MVSTGHVLAIILGIVGVAVWASAIAALVLLTQHEYTRIDALERLRNSYGPRQEALPPGPPAA